MKILELFKPRDQAITPEEEKAASTAIGKFGYPALYADKDMMQEQFEKLGWKVLGSGVFSMVLVNPSKKYVLKVNIQPDPGYQKYVDLILKHPNKYFPQISDMKLLNIQDSKYYVYLIEKLKPYREDEDPYGLSSDLKRVIRQYHTPINEIFPDGVPDIIVDNQELITALKWIRVYSRKYGYIIDIHSGNIMKRESGALVITDPYSFPKMAYNGYGSRSGQQSFNFKDKSTKNTNSRPPNFPGS